MKSSEAFPHANEPSDRSIDVELVESLAASMGKSAADMMGFVPIANAFRPAHANL